MNTPPVVAPQESEVAQQPRRRGDGQHLHDEYDAA
jgi:hypothetical protein